jgi:hypothetical protein
MSGEREAGFYWVYAKGWEVAEVAMWAPLSRAWLRAGSPTIVPEYEVGVMSGQLWPPEERSGCVHPPIFRHNGQCKRCGTYGLAQEDECKV